MIRLLTGCFAWQEHPKLRPATLRSWPFQLRRTVEHPGSYPVSIQLYLVEGLDKPSVTLQYVAQILSQESFSEQADTGTASNTRKRKRQAVENSVTASFVTQELDYDTSADEAHEDGS